MDTFHQVKPDEMCSGKMARIQETTADRFHVKSPFRRGVLVNYVILRIPELTKQDSFFSCNEALNATTDCSAQKDSRLYKGKSLYLQYGT